MNKPNFRKTPIALAMTGLLLTSTSAQAIEDPNLWGRWGAGTVDVSGGTLLVKDPLTGILGDQSILNPGLSNLSLDDSAVVAGDWILYGMFAISDLFDGGEGNYAAATGELTLIPPAEGAEGGGEVTVALNGFIATGLSFNCCGGTFPDGMGGEVANFTSSFSSTGAEGDAFFPDAPEFVPFAGEGELTSSLEGFEGGFGAIFGSQLGAEGDGDVDFLTGGNSDLFLLFGGEGFLFGAEGSYVAGQPTVDISALQAGDVTATYDGVSSLFGFDVFVEIDFQPATFVAEFDDFNGAEIFGGFAVSGTVNGSSFTSDTFLSAEGGFGADVMDAGVNGTLFGPNAEALGGIVTFQAEGSITDYDRLTFVDIFAATQFGEDVDIVELPDIAAPGLERD